MEKCDPVIQEYLNLVRRVTAKQIPQEHFILQLQMISELTYSPKDDEDPSFCKHCGHYYCDEMCQGYNERYCNKLDCKCCSGDMEDFDPNELDPCPGCLNDISLCICDMEE